MNRPAIPSVNDRRAFTFTEIINEGLPTAFDSQGTAVRDTLIQTNRCGNLRLIGKDAACGHQARASAAGNTSAPPNAVTRPRRSITIRVAN